MNTKISLCMIVKNEGRHIRRCLESAKGAVDEIIVVDTGSTDDTVSTALECGAKVYHFPWNGNFSDARNASLEPATGDWILFLDADEELAEDSPGALHRVVANSSFEGYIIKIINYLGEEGRIEPNQDVVFRLFRNRKEYRFRGAIHEQITGAIEEHTNKPVFGLAEGVTIRHYGYMDSDINNKDKINRNLRIIKTEIDEHPDDHWLRYHLGVELYRAGNYLEAAREFSKAAEGIGAVSQLVRYIVMCYHDAGEPEKALQEALAGIEHFPGYADLYYFAGRMCMKLKDYIRARDFLLKAVSLPEQPVYYASFYGVRGFRSYYHLGEIMEEFFNNSEALKFYMASLRDNPDFAPALRKIVHLLEPRKNAERAWEYLKQFSFCTPRANLLVGDILFRKGAYGIALEYFQKAVENQGAASEAQLWAAACHIQERRYDQSLGILDRFKPGNRLYLQALLNKMLVFWLQDEARQVQALSEEMAANGVTEEMKNVAGLFSCTPEKGNRSKRLIPGEEGRELLLDMVKRLLGMNETDRAVYLLHSLDPESLSGLLLDMARIFYDYEQGAGAINLLRQKLAGSEDGETHFLLAEILRVAGHGPEAGLHYRRAWEISPGVPRYCLRQIHLHRCRWEQLLQEARQKYPADNTFKNLSEEALSG